MSVKSLNRYELLTNQSMAATFTSPVTVVSTQDNVSYQIDIRTTDSIGTFKIQASNDYSLIPGTTQVANSGHWVDLTLGGGTPSAAAANDDINISLNQVPFAALRLVYTSGTAGTGHCDVWVSSKRLGG